MVSEDHHRATYTVRPHGKHFVVVRELSGPNVLAVEEEFMSPPITSAESALLFALRAAERFTQRQPTFTVEVRPAHAGTNTGLPECWSSVA